MSQDKKAISESSLARMAGNIAAGLVESHMINDDDDLRLIASRSVMLALLIIEEIDKTRPA